MIKVKATQNFNLKDFDKLKNIQRATAKADKGTLYEGDTFECNDKMAEYLTGNNDQNISVVEIIEVIPEIKEEPKKEVKQEVKKTTKKKKSK